MLYPKDVEDEYGEYVDFVPSWDYEEYRGPLVGTVSEIEERLAVAGVPEAERHGCRELLADLIGEEHAEYIDAWTCRLAFDQELGEFLERLSDHGGRE